MYDAKFAAVLILSAAAIAAKALDTAARSSGWTF
jgi:hypothetical protein